MEKMNDEEEVVDLLSSGDENNDDTEDRKENKLDSALDQDVSPTILSKTRKRKLILSSSESEQESEVNKDDNDEQENGVDDDIDRLSHHSQEDEDEGDEDEEKSDDEEDVNFTDEEIFNDDRMTVGDDEDDELVEEEEDENVTGDDDDDDENLNVLPSIDDLIDSIAVEVVENSPAPTATNSSTGGQVIVEMFDSDNEDEEVDAEDAERKARRKLVLDELKLLDIEESRLNEERSRIETMLANVRSNRDSLKRTLASLRGDESKNKTWGSESFPHSKALRHNLKTLFGFSEFRHLQLEVMNATMSRRDCFVVLPTGAGKSLLFQLPACVEGGITVVISPLLSLSRDQIMNLREKGIDATMISSEESPSELKSSYARIFSADPSLRLVYVTPEMLVQSKKFVSGLESLNRRRMLTRIVLDEAHCCSTMGHDFRPDYQKLFFIKRQFPNVPLLCVTATATVEVEEDCRRVLMQEALDPQWLVFRTSSNRKNLVYHVLEKKASANSSHTQILQLIESKFKGKSGIVYCFSRRDAEKAAEFLSKGGCPSKAYHARLSPEEKRRTHEQWRLNKVRVVCATTAFGMGIDKPDVRFVIHSTLSGSVEGYAQESGRAGRDGQQAECVLLYRRADVTKVMQLTADKPNAAEKVLEMAKYCENLSECRRVLLGRSFGEELKPESEPSKCCDVCAMMSSSSFTLFPSSENKNDFASDLLERGDFTAQAESLLRCFLELRLEGRATWKNVTFTQVVDAWKGDSKSSSSKKSLFHAPQGWSRSRCEQLAMYMLIERVFKVHFQYNSYAANVYIQEGERASGLLRQFHRRDVSIEFVYCVEQAKNQRTRSVTGMSATKRTKQQQQQESSPVKKRLKRDINQVVDILSDDSPQKRKSPGKKQAAATNPKKKKANVMSLTPDSNTSKQSTKKKKKEDARVMRTKKRATTKTQTTTTTTTTKKKKTEAAEKKKKNGTELSASTLMKMFQQQQASKGTSATCAKTSQNGQTAVLVLDGAEEDLEVSQRSTSSANQHMKKLSSTKIAGVSTSSNKRRLQDSVEDDEDDLWEEYPKSSSLDRRPFVASGSALGLKPTGVPSSKFHSLAGTESSSGNSGAAWNKPPFSSSSAGVPSSSFETPTTIRHANHGADGGDHRFPSVFVHSTATAVAASRVAAPHQPDFTIPKRLIPSLDHSSATDLNVLLTSTSTMAKRLMSSGGGGVNLLTQVARLPGDVQSVVTSVSTNKARNEAVFNAAYDDDDEDGFDPDEYYK